MNNHNQAPAGCDAVMAHLARPIPEVLWHYTTFAGFQGILHSKTIWATEYRFLNDSEEFSHARTLAEKLVEAQPESTQLLFPARDTLRSAVQMAFRTGLLHEERFSLMVASFSEVGDQLSQWRGYAGNSTGVSLGLDLRQLRLPSRHGQQRETASQRESRQRGQRLRRWFAFTHAAARIQCTRSGRKERIFLRSSPARGLTSRLLCDGARCLTPRQCSCVL
jgi:hypothetical protein